MRQRLGIPSGLAIAGVLALGLVSESFDSRGVRGKTLTTTNETGGEVRYYGIRFLQRTPVAQA